MNRCAGLRLLLPLIAFAFAGCGSGPVYTPVRQPAPALAPERLAPPLADDNGELPWVVSEAGRLTEPAHRKFAEVREATWNRDIDTAVRLLREMRTDDQIAPDHFIPLIFDLYADARRWSDSIAFHHEFELGEAQRERLKFAEFNAGLPARSIEFDAGAAPLPFTLKQGAWIIIEATVNGTKARLLVDTGCGLTWFGQSFLRRVGARISEQTIGLNDANGSERMTPIGLVQELRVGGMRVTNTPVLAGKSLLMTLAMRVDGILGWDVLKHADLAWDFPAGLMTLTAPNGPRSAEPSMLGNPAPVLTVTSPEGRPLHLFLDTGAAGGGMSLYDNNGVLATKTDLRRFRRKWRPTVTGGMFSWRIHWPAYAKPYGFWMDGYYFETGSAERRTEEYRWERMYYVDGVVGVVPFVTGTLRLSAVRREVRFELPATLGVATTGANQP